MTGEVSAQVRIESGYSAGSSVPHRDLDGSSGIAAYDGNEYV